MNRHTFTRRMLLSVTALAVSGTALGRWGTAAEQMAPKADLHFDKASFYTPAGKFIPDKAKDAIVTLCEHHHYPIYPNFRDQLWVSDYGRGDFAAMGLACVGFANHVAGPSSYMLSDLFLLPGQMLPEHWHLTPSNPECAQKDEGWLVRWGLSYIVGVGESNLPAEVVVPKCHAEVTVSHCIKAEPGDFVPLAKVGTRHWQFAGPAGAIITEVANAHDNASVRHTDQVANDSFLNG